ncbi:hypothetical protein ABFS82_13G067700 [Erythranthe guttata]|uniref:ATG8-interacting protein 1 n=1 Tax=Erythranthe guttata TaxID=4155 RepID=A0A022RWW4_ERYGU|nr:PREDICTED: uncharacterized protein LOC105968055 [Erythranthe guttata]XP_012848124.1 PREDICTED: uncharacterized protein LOC105968055 [Erythranthe guttata]EYU45012.1 hypothetical protein MIMGU_mgv1a010656mg [Erythranthe guttata]|eukprot:XP_012848118.1 PREDICTED: uncharacterized protein LOC105968055 [Erythranthe guttata]
MADNEEEKETAPRGNEWEVVSLTASAYAAAPGPEHVDSSQDSQGKLGGGEHGAETSTPMFMSGHFVFPPSQHENLPVEPDYNEIDDEKDGEDGVSELVKEERVTSELKDEENATIKGLISDEFPGTQISDEKANTLSVSGENFAKDVSFDKMQNIYSTSEFSSLHSETAIGNSNNTEESGDSVEPLESALDSDLQNFEKPVEGDKYDGVDLPCEAWWKRRAISVYEHAKEANTFWSIFIAATVMGLVIIGHRWQQGRWQILHLKSQFGINDERMGRVLGPIYRFKDVIVGGNRRGSLIRGSTSAER